MKHKRILIPTDLPFWRRRDGAEQRISEVVRFLVANNCDTTVFFLGELTDKDGLEVERMGFDVVVASSAQPPSDWLPRIRWYVDATLNQLRKPAERANDTKPMTLEEFRWEWAIQKFAEEFRKLQPDFVLVEYIKLAYLLDGLSQAERSSTKCLIDTHDVLHLRCADFANYGFQHWIQISAEEEAVCISRFDVAIAIQSCEAELFRKLAPQTRTIVARHSVERLLESRGNESLNSSFVGGTFPTVGYLGSKNDSNLSALQNFLEIVWPQVLVQIPEARLVVAGSVCSRLASEELHLQSSRNVEMMGFVDELSDFYSVVDFVVNPVEFGTGLKIKNCEPLAFGKPVVTTQKGWDGMDLPENEAVLVATNLGQMTGKILAIMRDADGYGLRTEQAVQLARSEFSDEKAYSELRQILFDL